ncbi:MAG: diguanylate cyclase [Nitrospinota bacterium]
MLDMLDSFNPDLLIMDLKLPRYNGFELARVLRQNNCYLTMPILFLTSSSQEASYIESLKAGSDDFLAKPANPQILIDSIRYQTKRYFQIRALTDQDGLTHMLNRASLMRQFESIFSRTARYREALSITMIDIDHFKTINDTYGHQAGDWVLRSLSNFLQEALRKSDIIGRYGGEEFILLLPQIGAEYSLRVVDRIRQDFERGEKASPTGEIIPVTFSAGIATYPGHGSSLDEIIFAADGALYESKRTGRNKVSLAKNGGG